MGLDTAQLNSSLSFHGLPKLCPRARSDPGSDFESACNRSQRNSPVDEEEPAGDLDANVPEPESKLKKRTLDFHSDSDDPTKNSPPKKCKPILPTTKKLSRPIPPKTPILPTAPKAFPKKPVPTTPRTPAPVTDSTPRTDHAHQSWIELAH
ncbi:uncharacterized protein BO95DRAFT_462255 [Aspergillus brunneoviolaceus CBS 621.78]|uniref:Uncharacterized protein n=1 Tax=Aspergillus brunneoviolaceus CBS 621.78 TaxID=1450534 RepID=A0ACD1GDB5_9EURO|nr:hypothetical protein BO95DRAFT_462255 [Aspergillus brunneoviolaceus CBS 621.78]RAH47225.1 hypothetical protein BO95DRAFT_462255 [Aspergillus brunneoviolaceus CBS 621.78]